MKMPFGKHKHKELSKVPREYRDWLLDKGVAKGPLKKYLEELKMREDQADLELSDLDFSFLADTPEEKYQAGVSDLESITNPRYLPQREPRLSDFGLDKNEAMFDKLKHHLDSKHEESQGSYLFEIDNNPFLGDTILHHIDNTIGEKNEIFTTPIYDDMDVDCEYPEYYDEIEEREGRFAERFGDDDY